MKKYYVKTFGCEMNKADSEKINMILLQSGFIKSLEYKDADLIILNTCSVRQKWEDRVFWILKEVKNLNKDRKKENKKDVIVWITWCMVRKTWLNKKYLEINLDQNIRTPTREIEYLKDKTSIFNNDDKLFPRMPTLDFTLRIEEIKYLNLILTHIYGEKIWSDDKFDDYLKMAQLRENKFSSSVIIQTGCDNFCTFCIVPYTRWREISREHSDIIEEIKKLALDWVREVSLVGQNVNSYWKQKNLKLWNEEKSAWNNKKRLNIWVDLDDSLIHIWNDEVLEIYNKKYNKNVKFSDITTWNMWDDKLKKIFLEYYYENYDKHFLYDWAREVLHKLKNDWHKLYVVTSRPEKDKPLTFEFLNREFWEWFFEDYLFTCDFWDDKKCNIANKFELDVVIDDAPHHIENYIKNTPCHIFVISQPWNESIIWHDKTYRPNSWENIYEKINSLYQFKSPFRNLLDDINKIEGIDRIRFTSSNPHDMTSDILDAHFELEKTCNYLHFALQSGNNEMLKKMNRRHTYEDFKKMVEYLRSKDPLFTISTDIIVWYSGETQEMFLDTVKAISELELDFVYIARYSVRNWTIASKIYPDDISDEIKAERWHILNSVLEENVKKRWEKMLWHTFELLVNWEKDEMFFGRTRNFKEVFFEKSPWINIWDIVKVKIIKIDNWVLIWELV